MDRTVLILSVGRVLQIVISLVSVRIFTTLLGTSEVGNFYLINSMYAFFALGLLNPLGVYISRRAHKWVTEGTLFDRLAQFNLYLALVVVVSAITIYLLRNFGEVGGNIEVMPLVILVALTICLTTWNQGLIIILNLLRHRVAFVVFSTVTLALGLGLSILFAGMIKASAICWLAGPLVAQGMVFIGAFIYLRKVVPGKFKVEAACASLNSENLRGVFSFAFPMMLTTLFMWLQNQSYRMIVEKNVGLEFLGMLGLSLGIAAQIANAVETLLQQIYQPVFYSEINTSDPEKRRIAWNNMGQVLLPIYFSLAMYVSCMAPFLLNILAHRKFAGAFMFVIFGAWIELFRMTTSLLANVAHAEMQTKYLIKSYFIGAIVAVFGVYGGTQFHDFDVAVPCALIASGLVTTTVMYLDMRKIMHIKVGIRIIKRSVLFSLPFLAALSLYGMPRTFLLSFLVVGGSGIYFLVTQYIIAKPLLKNG